MPASSSSAAEITLRCAHDQPPNYFYEAIWTKFKELVEERTGGRIAVSIVGGGQLGDEAQLVENLRIGTVHCAGASTGQISSHVPEAALLSVPYIIQSPKHRDRLVDHGGEAFSYLRRVLEKTGEFRMLGMHTAGERSVFNKVKPIKTLNDLAGLKIRTMTSNVQVKSFEALGAIPAPLPYAEVYSALQSGVVDGSEGSYATVYTQKYFEVLKYFSKTNHMLATGVELLSEIAYNRIPKDLRPVVMQAGVEASAHGRAFDARIQEEYLAKIVKEGVLINEVDLAPFIAKTAPLHKQFAKELGAEEFLTIILKEAKAAGAQ